MTFKSLLTTAGLALALLCGFAAPSSAQLLINETTLSSGITTSGQNVIALTAVTCTGCTFGPDTLIYVEREAMRVTGQYSAGSGTLTVQVRRGSDGTLAAPHANAAIVWYGPANRFHIVTPGSGANGDPAGACGFLPTPRANQPFLPWINVLTGNVWNCDGTGTWIGTNPLKLTFNSGITSGGQ